MNLLCGIIFVFILGIITKNFVFCQYLRQPLRWRYRFGYLQSTERPVYLITQFLGLHRISFTLQVRRNPASSPVVQQSLLSAPPLVRPRHYIFICSNQTGIAAITTHSMRLWCHAQHAQLCAVISPGLGTVEFLRTPVDPENRWVATALRPFFDQLSIAREKVSPKLCIVDSKNPAIPLFLCPSRAITAFRCKSPIRGYHYWHYTWFFGASPLRFPETASRIFFARFFKIVILLSIVILVKPKLFC